MLFVRDKGRLCNNILQYAHAYAWGRENGVRTMSMRFAYKYQFFRICNTRWHWRWLYVTAKTLAALKLIPVIAFHDVDYGEVELSESADRAIRQKEMQMRGARMAVVEGWYLRFYDLFLKYKNEILDLFAFNPDIQDKVGDYMQRTSTGECVKLGVHIRRGDYKTFKNGRFFYDDDVYVGFIRTFASLHSGQKVSVYLCGNDPALDLQYYIKELETAPNVKVHFMNGNPGEDLCMLSLCDYIIGPPSTFSLVGAMYHDIPLLWMFTSNPDSVTDNLSWGKFDDLFQHIE